MKTTRILISTLTFALIAGTASAEKLCQLDWLTAWKNASGTLSNSGYAWTRNTYTEGGAGGGTWAVTSDEGSSGVKHTVTGIAQCGTSSADVTGLTDNPAVDVSTIGNNKNCLCKMTYPNLGGSWVFGAAFAAAAHCANFCAPYCAGCVRHGTSGSCARSAVLALP